MPSPDKDFILICLWKKMSVAKRMHRIFEHMGRGRVLCGSVEDHYHRMKVCPYLAKPISILRALFPPVFVEYRHVEVGCLCCDAPLQSLCMAAGVLLWKTVRVWWSFRSRVLFAHAQASEPGFLATLIFVLDDSLQCPDLCLKHEVVRRFRRQLEVVLLGGAMDATTFSEEAYLTKPWVWRKQDGGPRGLFFYYDSEWKERK